MEPTLDQKPRLLNFPCSLGFNLLGNFEQGGWTLLCVHGCEYQGILSHLLLCKGCEGCSGLWLRARALKADHVGLNVGFSLIAR